jgi:hypothetical protein
MPKVISEITSGTSFQFSSSQGQATATQTRSFRVVLNYPGEIINVQQACGVMIGDVHPYNTDIYCRNYSAQYEGESRLIVTCTFTYEATPGSQNEDPNSKPPDIRPANWSTSATLAEVPAYTWQPVNRLGAAGPGESASNVVGDRLDGVSTFDPIVTISVDQWESSDPTKNMLNIGKVNISTFRIGSLSCARRTLMLRGITSRPAVESWGNFTYRGWLCTYELAYRQNWVEGLWDKDGQQTYNANIGWDLAVPQTGFNVKAFNPVGAAANQDVYGQPLKHKENKIDGPPFALPANINVGNKVRGMVLVHEYEAGGASQLPCAQPIPLNDDGTPRSNVANPTVLVYRYNPHSEVEFSGFRLRFL